MKRQNFLTLIFLMFFGLILVGCGSSHKEKVVLDRTYSFEYNRWNRFAKLRYGVNIEDTARLYDIILEAEVTPEVSADQIPVVFSIFSPDGGESHTLSTIYMNETSSFEGEATSGNKVIHHVVYSQRSFTSSGRYTFQYYQKHPKYELEGVKSMRIIIKAVPEE